MNYDGYFLIDNKICYMIQDNDNSIDDTTGKWHKIPSQELSDAMVEAFKNKLKDM